MQVNISLSASGCICVYITNTMWSHVFDYLQIWLGDCITKHFRACLNMLFAQDKQDFQKEPCLTHLLHICRCAGRPAPVSASRLPSDPPAGHWWWSASRCLYHQSQTDLCGSRTRDRKLSVIKATCSVYNKICRSALKLVFNIKGMFYLQIKFSEFIE